jgi:hypothetical protein
MLVPLTLASTPLQEKRENIYSTSPRYFGACFLRETCVRVLLMWTAAQVCKGNNIFDRHYCILFWTKILLLFGPPGMEGNARHLKK